MANEENMNLYDAKEKGDFQIVSVPEIGLLKNLGVHAGTNIAVQNRYALGGPVLLRVEGAFTVALGKDVARQITVREAVAQ